MKEKREKIQITKPEMKEKTEKYHLQNIIYTGKKS